MNIAERLLLYQGCIDLWGVEAQERMIIEEAGELLTALMKYTRYSNNVPRSEVLDELVDNWVMLDEAPLIYGFSQTQVSDMKYHFIGEDRGHFWFKRFREAETRKDYETQIKLFIRELARLLETIMSYSLDQNENSRYALFERIVFCQLLLERIPKVYNFTNSEVETRRTYKLDRLRNRYISSKNKREQEQRNGRRNVEKNENTVL